MNLPLVFKYGTTARVVKTNAHGVARIDDIPSGQASVTLKDFGVSRALLVNRQ